MLASKAYRVSRLSGVGKGKFAVVLFASAFGLPQLFTFLIITQVKHFLYVFFIFYLQNKNKITALQMSDREAVTGLLLRASGVPGWSCCLHRGFVCTECVLEPLVCYVLTETSCESLPP